MRHYVPIQHDNAWHVAYANHRGEVISVMECNDFGAAYNEAAAMTLDETKRHLCDTPAEIHGNRYLRKFQ
jgi:hypothetical protein